MFRRNLIASNGRCQGRGQYQRSSIRQFSAAAVVMALLGPPAMSRGQWPVAASGALVATAALEGPRSLPERPGAPKHCMAEGKRSNDPGRCCSRTTSGNICCGETEGSCSRSGCCAPGDTPFCHNGQCVACRPEGAQGEAASCCSQAASNGICCAEEFGACQNSGCCAEGSTPYCDDGLCVPCLTDGAPGDEESCCSGATTGSGMCCGAVGTTCAVSGCCAAGSTCDGEVCQECLVEGVASADPAECCSGAAENGVCCGLLEDSCANSGCCAEGLCADSVCIRCLPEGESGDDAGDCCSGEAANGVCCGEEDGICVDSGCCAGGQTCFQFHCFDCQPLGGDCTESDCCEGACCNGVCIPTDFDPENCGGCGNACAEVCCDGACIPACGPGAVLDPDTCTCVESCQEPGSSCGDNGTIDLVCCGDATCCGGTCRAPCPDGQALDPVNCQCRDACTGADGTFDPACETEEGFRIRVCCDGICCPLGDQCREGVCIGDVCNGGGVDVCPSGFACICRPPFSPVENPDGCVCCERCPVGAGSLSAHIDCRGGCGDCCSSCVDPQFDGSYECAD